MEPGTDRRLPAPELAAPAGLHVCHETIYQALYHGGKGGLNRQLTRRLRTGRPLRKRRRRADRRHLSSPPHCSSTTAPAQSSIAAGSGTGKVTWSATRRHVTERRCKNSAAGLSQQRSEAGGRPIRGTSVRLVSSPDNDGTDVRRRSRAGLGAGEGITSSRPGSR
jgi:hypothetical protein